MMTHLGNIAQGLVGVSFSLWRAVFLSDLSDEKSYMDDAEEFLGKLILDNAINYPQDRATREWTFAYYVNNAKYRLQQSARLSPEILTEARAAGDELGTTPLSKPHWVYWHLQLKGAVKKFSAVLSKK